MSQRSAVGRLSATIAVLRHEGQKSTHNPFILNAVGAASSEMVRVESRNRPARTVQDKTRHLPTGVVEVTD